MKTMRHTSLMLAFVGTMAMPIASMADAPSYPYPMHGPGMMMGYNPWPQLTPEQRQQMWHYMQQQGHGPGMMMGPGMMGYGGGPQFTPEQRQQMWEYMQSHGYGPGMMGPSMW